MREKNKIDEKNFCLGSRNINVQTKSMLTNDVVNQKQKDLNVLKTIFLQIQEKQRLQN